MAKPKVLFTFVEAGMGHIMPMTGILDAFTKKYGDRCEIVKSYIFSESEHEEIRKIGKMQADHAKRVSVDVLYHKLEGLSYHLSSRLTLKCLDLVYGKKAITLAAEDLQRINPDLIVSTYYLPSHFARIANERGYTHTLIATYTPDPYVYPAWDRKCDLYLTNNSAAYELAARKGFEKSVLRQVPYIYKGGLFDVTMSRGGGAKTARTRGQVHRPHHERRVRDKGDGKAHQKAPRERPRNPTRRHMRQKRADEEPSQGVVERQEKS